MRRLLLALAAAGCAQVALAQQTAPATPSITSSATVPGHTCTKPGEHPGRLASEVSRRGWLRDAQGYLECLKKYISDQQAIVAPLLAQAKPHLDAANAAVDEYNKSAAALKAEQDKNQ